MWSWNQSPTDTEGGIYIVSSNMNISQFISPSTGGYLGSSHIFFSLMDGSSMDIPVHVSLRTCVRGFLGQGFPNFLSKSKTEKDFCMADCGKQMRGKWQGLWLSLTAILRTEGVII